MLEKNKAKRSFIVDLFKYFPHMNLKIKNEVDMNNFEVYAQLKNDMDKKRIIDGNKLEIVMSFEVLKKRL